MAADFFHGEGRDRGSAAEVESVNVCLDAGQGNNVLAYVCCLGENLEADLWVGTGAGGVEDKLLLFWGAGKAKVRQRVVCNDGV